ncbi:SRPBCC domain-containing protein [Salinicoccus albus]|uniref:SRPBCC domain-containing protein n=1 Tax=Salinicoccus albus TaxID=418756 RepID=UPI000368BF5C|nr:SRPBCC domain-containing protein [Salinicoccus albus]
MAERKDRSRLVIDAPQEKIYQAFINREAFETWLPPGDMTGDLKTFDAVEGGAYEMTLYYHDNEAIGKTTGNSDAFKGRFVELVPYQRIVLETAFETGSPAFGGTMRQTWTLADRGGSTEVIVECTDVPSGIDQQDHERGLLLSLYSLSDYMQAD